MICYHPAPPRLWERLLQQKEGLGSVGGLSPVLCQYGKEFVLSITLAQWGEELSPRWGGWNLLLPRSQTTDSCAFFGIKTVDYSVLPFPWPSLPSPVLSMPLLCLCGAKSLFPSSAIPNQSYIPLLIHGCIQTPPSLSCVQLDLLDLLAVLKW